MRRFHPLLLALACTLCALIFTACGSAPHRDISEVEILHGTAPQNAPAGHVPNYRPTGPLIADSGFRPRRDGFAFENYGTITGIQELAPTQVEQLFGPEVCASGTRATCKLIPPAQTWLERENAAMAAGHCFGIAVAAEGFFSDQAHVDLFGASTPWSLQLTGNTALQQHIAQASALQEIPAIRSQAFAGTPNEILDKLIASLEANNTPRYTLGLFRANGAGGHALAPFAVEDRGDGRFAVLVYDSNHPGVTRAISFDRYADAWKFVAQTNPHEPKQVYSGHGEEGLLALYPTTIPHHPLPCPFCDSGHFAAKAGHPAPHRYVEINEISLSGDPTNHAHLLLTDPAGHHTGYIGHHFINQIPGLKVLRRLNNQDWLENPEPIYLVPVGTTVHITVDGRSLERPATERLDLVGPGDDLSVADIQLRPGQKVHITFKGDGSGLSYTTDPHHAETATLNLGVEDSPASYDFSVRAHHLRGGATLSLDLDEPHRQLTIATRTSNAGGAYDLRFHRITATDTQTFEHDRLLLRSDEAIQLNYRSFTHHRQTLPLRVTRKGQSRIVQLRG